MKLTLLLFALLALSALAAPPLCAGYTQRLVFQVFDQQFRPVEGAQVYVEYQLNAITGTTRTKPALTNASGGVYLLFTNYEEINDSTSYAYEVFVKYGSQLQTYNLSAWDWNTTRMYSGQVNSYFVFARAHDQKGVPLNCTITINGQSKATDAQGGAIFQLPPGSYTVKVEREGIVVNRPLELATDQRMEFTIGLYTMQVLVADDSGKPLIARIEVQDKEAFTNASGSATIHNITDAKPTVTVQYNGTIKKVVPDLASEPSVKVTFDITKPVVKELHAAITQSGAATVSLYVGDAGVGASGIDTVLVSYDVAGVENSVPAYGVGYNSFEAKIPAQRPGTIVRYSVRVTDKEGNVGFGSGTYSIPEAPVQNNTGAGQPQGATQMPIETIIMGIIVIAVVGFGAFYYLSKRRQDVTPPPVSPPQEPPRL